MAVILHVRIDVFCVAFGLGFFVSSRPMRLVPTELKIVYVVRRMEMLGLTAILRSGKAKKQNLQESENRKPAV